MIIIFLIIIPSWFKCKKQLGASLPPSFPLLLLFFVARGSGKIMNIISQDWASSPTCFTGKLIILPTTLSPQGQAHSIWAFDGCTYWISLCYGQVEQVSMNLYFRVVYCGAFSPTVRGPQFDRSHTQRERVNMKFPKKEKREGWI